LAEHKTQRPGQEFPAFFSPKTQDCKVTIMDVKSQDNLAPEVSSLAETSADAIVPHMKILVIEDDLEAAAYMTKAFREVGIVADHASDGEAGLFMGSENSYDVMVIDRMLPRRDGLSVISELRRRGVETPVLILSALGQVDDRVTGLRAGGDDYLPKPYAFSELLARIEVLGRRKGKPEQDMVYRVGDLELDRLSHEVKRGGKEILLQPREYRLLEYLMKHAGQVVTRTMLLENVWDYHFDPQTNVIDVHVSRLRSKIEKDFDKPLLKTIRGAGYMIKDEA
jgi:two-component system OmpR family response regulator